VRILVVIDSLGYGGAERLLVSLLPELQKQRIFCEIAVANPPYSLKPELENLGFKVHCLRLTHRWAIPEAAYKLSKIHKIEPFDVIWGHLYFGNLYAAHTRIFANGLKVIWTLHYKHTDPENLRQLFMQVLERVSLKFLVNSRVAVSQAVLESYPKLMGCNISCIYNGIPVDSLPAELTIEQKLTTREKFNVDNGAFLIVIPARYVLIKGHTVMCEALAILKDKYNWSPVCLAVGNGDLKCVIQHKIEDMNLRNNFRLLDALPQNELFLLIQSADAVVLPSLIEPFGIAAAEAMALGIPTVLTDIDGFKELVGASNSALKIPVNDPSSLAEALWQLRSNPELRKAISLAGRKRIYEKFNISKIANDWRDLFFELKMRLN
jgi:glycosyltransferase involved in cell wall biosynthesis